MKIISAILLMLISFTGFSQEKILGYHSDIEVNKDRSVTVTEHIKVRAEGYNIQRGIFRDVPTSAVNQRGNKIKYDFEVLQVLKDGQEENYALDKISDGVRIRIGHRDVFLDPGNYEYTIQYRMSDQVRFFDQYDELYWNVTGNEWMFTIDEASATVTLPNASVISQHHAYSGAYGDSGCNCTFEQKADNKITYRTTQPLGNYQGLTIAIGWNKGAIPPPTEAEIRAQELAIYKPVIYGGIGIMLIFFYYLWAWFRVGRDPKKGSIVPRFEAPKGFTPAAARYVMRMGYDKKAFTASIVSMAVKGFLTIDKSGKNYELIKNSDDEASLSEGEKAVAKILFRTKDKITIKQTNHSTLSSAIDALKRHLGREFNKVNFSLNLGWLIPGFLLSVAICIMIFAMNLENDTVIVSIIISFFITMFTLPFVLGLVSGFRNRTGFRKWISLILLVGIPIFVIYQVTNFFNVFDISVEIIYPVLPYFILVAVMISMNALFIYLIKAPTVLGRQRMDEIEGLKMYMEVAEKHRFDRLNPPDMTPQLFEKLLPYAIALGVENEWGKQFNDIIKKAIDANEYHPGWYSGNMRDFYMVHALSSNLGSNFSSAISSASISPQSSGSSGSGGGGFSGGGGGGGGGGGW